MQSSADIRQRLPHRYPFLLLDRVVDASPERVVAEKHVTVNEPYFRGHFPNSPVMPGVLILEALFQLVWLHWGGEHGFHLCGVRRFKFRRSVLPGDLLELEAVVLEPNEEVFRFRCCGRVEGKVAAEGELLVRSRKAVAATPLTSLTAVTADRTFI